MYKNTDNVTIKTILPIKIMDAIKDWTCIGGQFILSFDIVLKLREYCLKLVPPPPMPCWLLVFSRFFPLLYQGYIHDQEKRCENLSFDFDSNKKRCFKYIYVENHVMIKIEISLDN